MMSDREHGRTSWPLLGGTTVFYLILVVAQATLKLLWGDELITLFIARQGSPARIWTALAAGADPNPPLIHLCVLLCTRLFGSSALAIRLPSIVFGLIALLAMWTILRRWVSPVWASVGLLGFMATRGFDYSYDARSYAPMMGLAMLSLALWMALPPLRGWRFGIACAVMSAALAGGLCSNYYCVLAFFPIAAGEGVRCWRLRQMRPAVWLALAVGSLPLTFLLPLIRHNLAEFGPYAWNRPRFSMIGLSYLELVEGMVWPVLGTALYLYLRRRTLRSALCIGPGQGAAMLVLIIDPFLGFALAVSRSAMISPRCAAPVCCGFGLAAGLLGARAFPQAGKRVLIGMVLWVGIREAVCSWILLEQRKAFFTLRHEVEQSPAGTILVADSSFVLPLSFYADTQVRERIVFPVDFAAIHRVEADDSGEENLWSGRQRIFPFPIVAMRQVRLAPGMLLIARPGGWLAQAVTAQGFVMQNEGDAAAWSRLGGVFTPMAHPETRLLQVHAGGR